MANSLTPLMTILQSYVSGPRDWYRIEHCKTGRDKQYFHVTLAVWKESANESWPQYFEGESVHLSSAIKQAIQAVEEKDNIDG